MLDLSRKDFLASLGEVVMTSAMTSFAQVEAKPKVRAIIDETTR